MNQDNKNKNQNKKPDEFSKKIKEVAKELKLLLSDLVTNRELTQEEKKRRAFIIENYLQGTGGTIIAISCKDGILLFGVNPQGKQSILRVFHRISLLALGKSGDYKDIHLKGLISVLGRWLNRSSADIDVKEITEKIAQLIEKNFNHFKSKRETGPYKANFIICELGFDADEDFISIIDFLGNKSIAKRTDKCNYAIVETPSIIFVPVKTKTAKSAENKDSGKTEFKFEDSVEIKPRLVYLVSDILELLTQVVYSGDEIWTIREAALFVGLILFLFNNREDNFEMDYLDRNMLKKTNLGNRRFHHIWNSITSPDPYCHSDAYQNWKKFTASLRKQLRKGRYRSEFKILFELLDILYEKKVNDKKKKELLEKMAKQDIKKILVSTLKGMTNKK